MTTKDQLVEQHFRAYESRLRHIDELYARAEEKRSQLDEAHAAHQEFDALARERQKLQRKLDEIRTLDVEHWREDILHDAGPMAIWDILAQKLEDFIERHE